MSGDPELTRHLFALQRFGAEVRYWRTLRGCSLRTVASAIRYSRLLLSMVESAQRRPHEDLAKRLDEYLDTGGALQRLIPEVNYLRTPRASAVHTQLAAFSRHQDDGSPDDTEWITVQIMLEGETRHVTLSRRALLQAAQAGAVAALPDLHQTTTPTSIDPAIVDYFSTLRAFLVDADNRFGGLSVRPTTVGQLEIIAGYRRSARGRLRVQLLSTEARWAEFSGWLSDDLGDVAAGTRWIGRAMDLAQEAQDTELLAFLFARRAQRVAIGLDRDRLLDLADSACRAGGPAHVSSFAATQRAHGHATLGNEKPFRESIDEARLLVDGVKPIEGSLGSFCGNAYLSAQEGEGWLRLGKPRQATQCFQQALADWPPSYRRERGLCLSRVANAQLAAGEVDQAASNAMQALRLADTTASTRIRRELVRVGERIVRHADRSAVSDLLAELATTRPNP